MPIETILPWAQLGTDILSTGANALLQAANNRQQHAFAREMYTKQRNDSLLDWNMQNQYNSPAEQMARLKKAGLNPNLVYGNGATATSGSMPRASSASTPNTNAPRLDSPNFMGIYDLQMRKADMAYKNEAIENLRKDRQVKDAQILETMSRVPGYALKQDLDRYQIDWNKSTDQLRKDALGTGIAKTQADTKYTLDQNERAAAMQSSTLQEAAQRIIDLKYKNNKINPATYKNLMQDLRNKETINALGKADLKLREKGIYPGDPAWLRLAETWFGGKPGERIGDTIKRRIKESWEKYKNVKPQDLKDTDIF